jgi:parallel beta-helix repeat protein
MKHQGFSIQQLKTFRPYTSKFFRYNLRLPVALSTLLLLASGSMLMPIEVNADTTDKKDIASPQMAQVPTNGTQIPANGTQVPTNGTQIPANGTQVPTNGTQIPANGTQVPTNGTQIPATGTQIPATGTQIPATGTQIPATGTQIPATGTQIPATGTQTPATGTVIYVNPQTGSDAASAGTSEAQPYKTITFALNQAQPGATIQLAPGTYSKESGEVFPLTIKQGVILRGDESTKGQAVLITGSGTYISPTFAKQNVTIKTEKDSTITGVTVTNSDSRGTAVWVESTNPTISNSTFTNSVREGVFVTGKGNPKIENNIFVQNKGNGVSVAKSASGEIRNNLFQDTGFGLAIGGTSTPLIEGNQILQNQDGIYISESAKPILRKNVIQNNKRDGVVATINALPDLGTGENPGSNLIRNNTRHDLNNATKTNKIFAIGNDIDVKKIAGLVEFIASTVEPPPGGSVAFKDVVVGYWAKGYIEALASRNIIAGFPDGTFKPNDPVTRAQFAAIVTKAFSLAPKREATNFKDISSKFWAYDAIQNAYRVGFVSGYPDRTFQPEQQIPRVQALVSLSSGLNLTTDNPNILSFYSDSSQIPNYATAQVAAATSKLLVVNYPSVNQLNPNRQATRAEVAAFVYQALVNSGKADPIPSPYLVRVQ